MIDSSDYNFAGPHFDASSVRRVRHNPTKTVLACKTIEIEAYSHWAVFNSTLETVSEMPRHANVVTTVCCFQEVGRIRVVMEYVNRGSLEDLVRVGKGVPVHALRCVASGVLAGIAFLSGLASRSAVLAELLSVYYLTPARVLLGSNGEVKLSGLAPTMFRHRGWGALFNLNKRPHKHVAWYDPPGRVEQRCSLETNCMWGLGLLVAEAALGRFPVVDDAGLMEISLCRAFHQMDAKGAFAAHVLGRLQSVERVDAGLADFLNETLQVNPALRASLGGGPPRAARALAKVLLARRVPVELITLALRDFWPRPFAWAAAAGPLATAALRVHVADTFKSHPGLERFNC